MLMARSGKSGFLLNGTRQNKSLDEIAVSINKKLGGTYLHEKYDLVDEKAIYKGAD